MTDTVETNFGKASLTLSSDAAARDLEAWFVAEILPLEAGLMQFLRRSGRGAAEISDLRQEIYLRVCQSAKQQIPHPVKPFVFSIARNLLVDQMRRDHVIPIDAVTDLDALNVAADIPGPDRITIARDELRRVRVALEDLPPRAREVVILRRLEGLPRGAIAMRMGITEKTVSEHLTNGLRALANLLYSEFEITRGPK